MKPRVDYEARFYGALLQPGLRELVESVTALESAARDDAPHGAWDTAKWKVFNAAVRFVKVEAAPDPRGEPRT